MHKVLLEDVNMMPDHVRLWVTISSCCADPKTAPAVVQLKADIPREAPEACPSRSGTPITSRHGAPGWAWLMQPPSVRQMRACCSINGHPQEDSGIQRLALYCIAMADTPLGRLPGAPLTPSCLPHLDGLSRVCRRVLQGAHGRAAISAGECDVTTWILMFSQNYARNQYWFGSCIQSIWQKRPCWHARGCEDADWRESQRMQICQ